ATGTLTDTASVTPPSGATDPNTADNTASDSDTIALQADLQVTVSDGKSRTTAGGIGSNYGIKVTNMGPSAATGAIVKDNFPATYTGVTYTATQSGGASGFTANGTGNINDTVMLPAGSSVTYTSTGNISPSATGTISNTATVTAPSGVTDPNPANNSATDTDALTIKTGLSITVNDGKTKAIPGQKNTYTIKVNNAGPSTAKGAVILDMFPSNFSGVTFTAIGSNGASGFSANGSGDINNTVLMPPKSTITYTATGTISSSATGTLTDTASVTPPSGATDPNTADNTASDSDTIALQADLQVTVSDGKSRTTAGGIGSNYGIKVT